MVEPILEEIAGEYSDKLVLAKLNIDDNPQSAANYGVMSIPTLLIFKGGEEVGRKVGADSKRGIENWISDAI